ncbi:MAG: TolB-like protein [Candidatus Azotimanducaceae bacterium]
MRRDKPVLTVFSEAVQLSPGLNMALESRQAILRNGLSSDEYKDQLVRAAEAMIRPTDLGKPQADRNSIAIMRFENLSSDPDNAYLADGIAEELLTGLSQIKGASVASRSSSFAIKSSSVDVRQIGQQLGVAWVLEGSVRRSGQRIRLNARLSDSHGVILVWAEKFDRELVDLFDLQDDIAGSVLNELSSRFDAKLDAPHLDFGTDNIEAYNAYLQGRHESVKFTGKACDLAVDHLRSAIQLDPDRKIVNWDAADKMVSDDFGSVLDVIEKTLTGVGLEWQNELRNRALALAPVTGISVMEGVFTEQP